MFWFWDGYDLKGCIKNPRKYVNFGETEAWKTVVKTWEILVFRAIQNGAEVTEWSIMSRAAEGSHLWWKQVESVVKSTQIPAVFVQTQNNTIGVLHKCGTTKRGPKVERGHVWSRRTSQLASACGIRPERIRTKTDFSGTCTSIKLDIVSTFVSKPLVEQCHLVMGIDGLS